MYPTDTQNFFPEAFLNQTLIKIQSYRGVPLSRKQIAAKMEMDLRTFNRFLKQVHKLDIGKRRILTAKEISLVIDELGDWRKI
jgi:hypothetical protein